MWHWPAVSSFLPMFLWNLRLPPPLLPCHCSVLQWLKKESSSMWSTDESAFRFSTVYDQSFLFTRFILRHSLPICVVLLIHFVFTHPAPALCLSKMRHPIWGPICWMILNGCMPVHTSVFYAKVLSTLLWPICSLFIYPICCPPSIFLSLCLWPAVSDHISLGCSDWSHWYLSDSTCHKNICTILDRVH